MLLWKAFGTVCDSCCLILVIILSWCLISWKDMRLKVSQFTPTTMSIPNLFALFTLSIAILVHSLTVLLLCLSVPQQRIKLYLFFFIISNIFPYNINKSFFALLLWASSSSWLLLIFPCVTVMGWWVLERKISFYIFFCCCCFSSSFIYIFLRS